MTDQPPSDAPPPTGADDNTAEIEPTPPEPIAAESKDSWANKQLSSTRAIVLGTAAGILLIGGFGGFVVGAAFAGGDSEGYGPHRSERHGGDGYRSGPDDRGEWGQMPDRGPAGMPPGFSSPAPDDFGQQGPDAEGSTSADPSDSNA